MLLDVATSIPRSSYYDSSIGVYMHKVFHAVHLLFTICLQQSFNKIHTSQIFITVHHNEDSTSTLRAYSIYPIDISQVYTAVRLVLLIREC
jgi:hypothetical protein